MYSGTPGFSECNDRFRQSIRVIASLIAIACPTQKNDERGRQVRALTPGPETAGPVGLSFIPTLTGPAILWSRGQ